MSEDPAMAEERRDKASPYRLDDALLDLAAAHALALHCLPAHLGQENHRRGTVGERQPLWDQTENGRYAQKALLVAG
jgi:ornithine carbamoyltransferase